MSRKRDALNLNELAIAICPLIPEDWTIEIRIVHEEISISLFDAESNDVEICMDDLTTNAIIVECVNHARKAEGLPVARVPGVDCENEHGCYEYVSLGEGDAE